MKKKSAIGKTDICTIGQSLLRSDKAYSLIALTVEKSLQVHITSTTDPRISWETLRKQFEFISITQIVRLNRKFYAATMKEGTDIIDHLTYMTSLAEHLRELKEEISDKKFATVVLGSLPESYDNFILSLNARNVEGIELGQYQEPTNRRVYEAERERRTKGVRP